MQTSRVRSAGVAAKTLRTGTIASRNGSATVAPTPRRNVRRGNCLPVMKSTCRLLYICAIAVARGFQPRVGAFAALKGPRYRVRTHWFRPLHLERVALHHPKDEGRQSIFV